MAACGSSSKASGTGPTGVVFGDRTVTLFDPTTHRVTGTRSTDASVEWLSTTQRFWDGHQIWTYGYPGGHVQAVTIEPTSWRVAERIGVGGQGPAHSLVLAPDLRRAYVNAAGSDAVAVVDTASRQVVGQVRTGAYP